MQREQRKVLLVAALCALLAVSQAGATMLQHMELGELVQRADRIFRGTVIDVEQSSVEAGGGELPMVLYRLRVEEMVKGEADVVKGDEAFVEIRMVGSLKDQGPQGGLERFDMFRDVPRLTMGSDYLLLTTPTSAIGLSTTVGLGQGAFSVHSVDKTDYAVNQFDNAGLGLDGSGAVPYADLVTQIKGLMGQ
jgi:hypothetical protein